MVATSYVCRSKTGRAGRGIVLLQIFEIIALKVKWKKDWILSVSNGIRTNYHFVRKRIQYSIISTNWPNELSGCGFESLCCHLNLRYRACFEQGVTWYPGNYRVALKRLRDMIIKLKRKQKKTNLHLFNKTDTLIMLLYHE